MSTRVISASSQRPDDVVADEVTALIPGELLGWLFQALEFPVGAALPPPGFTLAGEDVVRIVVPGVGTLVNPVEVVGTTRPRLTEEARR